jgi:hypothetical protein
VDVGGAIWVGQATYGAPRSDVAAVYGSQFTNVGFSVRGSPLPPGRYAIVAYAHSTVSGTFNGQSVDVSVPAASVIAFGSKPD